MPDNDARLRTFDKFRAAIGEIYERVMRERHRTPAATKCPQAAADMVRGTRPAGGGRPGTA